MTGIPAPPALSPIPLPSRAAILRLWLGLGLQSFGGGAATLALIRRVIVQQRGWMTDAEFVRDWALCQVAPGINLVCLTILIGRRLGGAWGIVLSVTGLLLPSAAATVMLTASFVHFQHNALMRHAIQGVVPATVGVGLLTAGQIGLPMLAAAHREGRAMLTTAIVLLVGAALCAAFWQWPTVAILCGAGGIGALTHWAWDHAKRTRKTGAA